MRAPIRLNVCVIVDILYKTMVHVRCVEPERIEIRISIYNACYVPCSRRRRRGAPIRRNVCVIADILDKMVVRVRYVDPERTKFQTAIHNACYVPRRSRRRRLGAPIRLNACVIVDILDKTVVRV